MQVDDSIVIKKWVKENIAKSHDELKAKADSLYKEFKSDQEKIWEENLLVPEVIGEGRCPFDNMQQYIKYQMRNAGRVKEETRQSVMDTAN